MTPVADAMGGTLRTYGAAACLTSGRPIAPPTSPPRGSSTKSLIHPLIRCFGPERCQGRGFGGSGGCGFEASVVKCS
ncbi:hypothetical protein K458DRAFT_418304 [Lentithecium fluviatile CBS 122367]|uniref:Uncharacterized protein n=1 Tax=Lentithecium fluviatile CBS 122367 TaxID=1168545 RepID=A0A6G1J189_9PLEO|nr:hypothetical protein K458DRAFT_418304 [Lentithecium fluviatile CBS 122367]